LYGELQEGPSLTHMVAAFKSMTIEHRVWRYVAASASVGFGSWQIEWSPSARSASQLCSISAEIGPAVDINSVQRSART
jgi:hypothetical protein